MKYYCLQLFENDCGLACIKSLLAFYYKDEKYLMINQSSTDKKYSLYDLENISNQYGLKLESYEIDDYSCIKRFPYLAYIKTENESYHFIINNIKKENVYIFDPKVGERIIELDYLRKQEKKIVSIPRKPISKRKDKFEKINLIPYQIFLISSKALEIFCLFMLSFEIKNLNLKLLFYFLCFLFIKVINYFLNIKFMKNYDKKYLLKDIENKNIKNEFILKKDIFSFYNDIYTSLMITIFLMFVLMINDLKNAIVLLILSFSYIGLKKIFNSINLKLKEKINKLENDKNYIEANYLSYKIPKNEIIVDLIITIIILICSLIICYINKNENPLIYYTIIYLVIFYEMKKIIDLKNSKINIIKKINLHFLTKDE